MKMPMCFYIVGEGIISADDAPVRAAG